MTKSEFQDLLHRYTSTTREEAEQVLLLEKEYPYSQLLHSLAARVSKDHSFQNQQNELQLAAVYSADRHVLKEIMSRAFSQSANGGATVPVAGTTIDAIDYADEVMHDLELLDELKHNFEMLFIDSPGKESKASKAPIKVKKTEASVKAEPKKKAKKAIAKKKGKTIKAKTAKSKTTKSKITQAPRKKAAKKVVKATKKIASQKKTKTPAKAKKTNLLKKNVSGDSLIAEIANTKRALKPENSKQREQLQIIDQFIKAQPSISNARDRIASVPTGDLASFKQGEFGDQIISETLVAILLKQGKKDKAIDVLKKLIWKFPQKKTYFAAQIQELKK